MGGKKDDTIERAKWILGEFKKKMEAIETQNYQSINCIIKSKKMNKMKKEKKRVGKIEEISPSHLDTTIKSS